MLMNCNEFSENLPLLLYDELPLGERATCEAHLAGCSNCQSLLEESRRMQALLSKRTSSEPAPDLLVRCRLALDEALDREQMSWGSALREWLPRLGLVRPAGALAALTLVVLGFGLGWTLRPRTGVLLPGERDASPVSTMGLGDARISGISQVSPDPKTGGVRITLDAERRMTLEGSLDDDNVRKVLVYALKSYDNPGIRVDTLQALRTSGNNPSVQPELLNALRNDPNLGVRLEALKAVRRMNWNSEVRQALLDVVHQPKANQGLRGAVVDELVKHAVKDKDVVALSALEQLAANDPNDYVRVKSLRALVALGADNN
jgi:hypothetical protein